MTLKDIIERLEHISQNASEWTMCPDCEADVKVDDSEIRRANEALRLDIERHILKTEGTL